MPAGSLRSTFIFMPAIEPLVVLRAVNEIVDRAKTVGIDLRPVDEEHVGILGKLDLQQFADDGNTLLLTDGVMQQKVDEDWMLDVQYMSEDAPKRAEVEWLPRPSTGDAADINWEYLMKLLPIAAAALRPSYAVAYALDMDEESDDEEPWFDDLPPRKLPSGFAPWTYIADERLDESAKERLAKLDAIKSEPLAGGWVVQAVERYSDAASKTLVRQIKELGKKTRYIHTR